MNCNRCQPHGGRLEQFPFVIQEPLFTNPYDHKSVFIHRCKECGSLYIGVGIQAFDDDLSYWVPASAEEITALQSLKDTPEVFRAAKEIIESKPAHIAGDRDGRYYFRVQTAFVLSDMPSR